jgi:hypothetical protein
MCGHEVYCVTLRGKINLMLCLVECFKVNDEQMELQR